MSRDSDTFEIAYKVTLKNRALAAVSQKGARYLHGSVATCLSCDRLFDDNIIADLPVTLAIKNFENRSAFGE